MAGRDRSQGAGSLPRELADLWAAWLRPWTFRAPLSGDVWQRVTDAQLFRQLGQQLGFININTGAAGDAELERQIVEQVASYGRQLGRLLDAVDVLIRHDRRGALSDDDARALAELQRLHDQIATVKAGTAAERVDRLVEDIRALRRDPDANREALDRLRDALA
jgi:hypothetical protein